MRNALNVFLLIVLVAVLAVNWVIRHDPAQRNFELMAAMVNSVAAEAQAENTAIEGGNTSLQPVAGTIARGYIPLHYGATPEEAKRAGEALASQLAADDSKALDRGAVVYGNFCAVCHGPAGMGDGTVTTRGFPPPPSLFAENAMNMKDGQIFHLITYGQKNMPSYTAQVSRDDRWNVILYIRSLQKKQLDAAAAAAQAAATPAAVPAAEAAATATPAPAPTPSTTEVH